MDSTEPPSSSHCKLFYGATIITINAKRQVIRDGYIRVEDGRIAAVGKCPYSQPLPVNTTEINCSGKIIIPGLINTHAHLVQSLLRGLAEDLPLHNWLCDAVWPLEAVFDGNDGFHAARLTIAEMLKTGTTCFLDPMLTYRAGFDQVCTAVGEMGIRGCLGKLVKFTETNRQLSISDPRDQDLINMSIPALLAAHKSHHHSFDDRIHVWAAAGTPRGAPKSAYSEFGTTCSDHGISITMHCAESPKDLDIYRDTYHCSPMEFIRDTKLCPQPNPSSDTCKGITHRLVLAHMVNLDEEIDLPLLSYTQTSVAHNPTSNLKLASGVAPIPSMLANKDHITVSLGSDGAPCSNHYDMFQEMHLASILHKGVNRDASLVPAEVVLEMATINGARALGLDKDIGSLEAGKKADFVVIDPYGQGGLGAAPWSSNASEHAVSPVTTVVHGCTGRDVDMTVVGGEVLVKAGTLVVGGKGKEAQIVELAQTAVKGILERANHSHGEDTKIGGKLASPWHYI